MGAGQRVLYDFYSKEAKRLGFVARSAFKLLEVQERFRVIPRAGRVLDLGCHPGAWLQAACRSLGGDKKSGRVLGIDLQKTAVPSRHCDARVTVWQADARALTDLQLRDFEPRGFHTVLSDMCPSTSGSSVLDTLQSLELQRVALQLAIGKFATIKMDEELLQVEGSSIGEPQTEQHTLNESRGILMSGGCIVMKLLEGSGTRDLGLAMRPHFQKVAYLRPKATRDQSREIYLIGQGRK